MPDITIDKYKSLSEEIHHIRERINKIDQNKEHWFKRKEDLKKEINIHIEKIKEIKAEKDRRNLELQELKKQRDKYNDEVKKLIKRIKELNEEKEEAFKKYNVKVDPKKIQEKINQLEKKVEIETNFEKEKKLMEEIKKLKKAYEESSEILKLGEKAELIDKEIKESRKKADEFHRRILEITKDTTYDVFIDLSKKINALKSEQEAAFQKFIDHKNDYATINYELRNRLEELKVLDKIFEKNKEIIKIKEEGKQRAFLLAKTRVIEEKIRNKEKLTTEDIIAMQGTTDETFS